uniref:CARD domain-containing protein n=1 Tax=Oreochromis niloticus TaxID=8128 RepID=A0A669F5F1_ORENI
MTLKEMLMAVRSQFIDRVSEAVLSSLLDKLLERRIVIDDEIDLGRANGRVNNARRVIDMVRRKGSQACSTLIAALSTGHLTSLPTPGSRVGPL